MAYRVGRSIGPQSSVYCAAQDFWKLLLFR